MGHVEATSIVLMQKGEPMSDLIEIVLIALACPLALPLVIEKDGEQDERFN